MIRMHTGLGALVCLVYCSVSHATNGLNAIGFGAHSMGLAGADVAATSGTDAANVNPAGLSEINNHQADVYVGLVHALDMGHKDQFGNDVQNELDLIPLGNVGYAQRMTDTPFSIGIGLFGQGGAGVEYSRLYTAFGTQDRLSSVIRIPVSTWRCRMQQIAIHPSG